MRAQLLMAQAVTWETGGRRILGPLTFSLGANECLAVIGPNGAGKTTLLRLALGLLAPSSGSWRLDGIPYSELTRRDVARRLAYVPQMRSVNLPLSVEELVAQGRYPHLGRLRLGLGAHDHEVIARAIEAAGIGQLKGRAVAELSGGEQQAAALAAALAQEPEVLVLDEPTAHLDPRHQLEVARLVHAAGTAQGKAVLVATHDVNLAARVADRVLALRQGSILALAPPRTVLTPEVLEELFAAPFRMVDSGERPLSVIEWGNDG